eukprot:scaffold662848_cov111-Prasinocladus_malaysianus.AAC.1
MPLAERPMLVALTRRPSVRLVFHSWLFSTKGNYSGVADIKIYAWMSSHSVFNAAQRMILDDRWKGGSSACISFKADAR